MALSFIIVKNLKTHNNAGSSKTLMTLSGLLEVIEMKGLTLLF